MKKKTGILIAAVVLSLTVAGILAFQMDMSNKKNTFSIGHNEIQINETYSPPETLVPGNSYTKQVQVTNTESVPCYIRVFAEFSDSRVSDYVSLDINTKDWTKEADGYYYYKNPVQPKDKTTMLFEHFQISEDATEEQVKQAFDIIVNAESVQSEGFASYQEAFHSIKG